MNPIPKKLLLLALAALPLQQALAVEKQISSPNGKLVVTISDEGGKPTYHVTLDGKTMLETSRLGLTTNVADFTNGLSIGGVTEQLFTNSYTLSRSSRARWRSRPERPSSP